MYWWKILVLILIIVIIIYIVSFAKVDDTTKNPSSLEQYELAQIDKMKNVLFLTAHPDDETMFFAPTIINLKAKNKNIHILCLSNGNHEGLGKERTEEMVNCVKAFDINSDNLRISDFEDGPGNNWNLIEVAKDITKSIKEWNIDTIITFDQDGVSGHTNHKSCFHSLRHFLISNEDLKLQAYSLKSINSIVQYTGPYKVNDNKKEENKIIFRSTKFRKTWKVMAQHKSQFTWYRKTSIILSQYTFVNELIKL